MIQIEDQGDNLISKLAKIRTKFGEKWRTKRLLKQN